MGDETTGSVEFLIKTITENKIFIEVDDSADFLIDSVFTDEMFRIFVKEKEHKFHSVDFENKKSVKIIKKEFGDLSVETFNELLKIQSNEILSKKLRIYLIESMLQDVAFTEGERMKMEKEIENLRFDMNKLEKGYKVIRDVQKKLHEAFIGDSF